MSSEWKKGFKKYKSRHSSGHLKELVFYRDGKRIEDKIWYENGRPRIHEFYQNGERTEYKSWYINGKIDRWGCCWTESKWQRGWLDIDGAFSSREFYRNGRFKKFIFCRLKRCFRNCAISQINQMLISDLVKTI